MPVTMSASRGLLLEVTNSGKIKEHNKESYK